jgi:hypothetical protein
MLCGSRQIARTAERTANGIIHRRVRRRSGSGATIWPCPTALDLSGVPSLNLGPEPETWATTAQIEDRPGHIGIPMQVLADGIPVSEPEDAGNIMRVDQIIDEYSTRHKPSLHVAADGAYTCEHLSVRYAV